MPMLMVYHFNYIMDRIQVIAQPLHFDSIIWMNESSVLGPAHNDSHASFMQMYEKCFIFFEFVDSIK